MIQDHFERHSHHAGAVDWNFNIVFNNQPEVATMAEAYKPLLTKQEFYEPIPTQWLHGTILRVGKFEDYTEDEMLTVAGKVQDRLRGVRLPRFSFGELMIVNGNVCFRITPDDALKQLYTAVTESLHEVVGAERTAKSPHGDFLAHTSLAYRKFQYDEAAMYQALSAADIKPATFTIKHMPLIKQRPVGGHYEWEVVKDILIG